MSAINSRQLFAGFLSSALFARFSPVVVASPSTHLSQWIVPSFVPFSFLRMPSKRPAEFRGASTVRNDKSQNGDQGEMSLETSNEFKRSKLESNPSSSSDSDKKIGTHNGTFQADEALGVWLLRQLPLYRNAPVVRTRDPALLEKCDIVIDVGGIYDHGALRYDHHQRGYDEKFDPKIKLLSAKSADGSTSSNVVITEQVERCTKLSASGLVYRHYGKDVIRQHYPNLSKEMLDLAYVKMYDSFMEPIDAIDTGVEPIPPGIAIQNDSENDSSPTSSTLLKLQYHDKTGLSLRVSRLNPRWNELIDETTNAPPDPDARFQKASQLCGDDFMSMLTSIVESDLPARSHVETAVLNRKHQCDPSGEIICLPAGGLPWKNHLYELEKIHNVDPLIKYVLYTDQSNNWRIQAVTIEGRGFENRLSLPKDWRGVRDDHLSQISGIDGCIFCHANGFIGGNKSFEGVLKMARVALARRDEEE